MSRDFPENAWALILGGSSGFGLATAQRLAEHGMNLLLVHRDRRAAVRRLEPELEKMRGHGVAVHAWNADALSADVRASVLAEAAEILGERGRIRALLHSIAFGNLKLLVPEKPWPRTATDALARKLGIEPDRLRRAADELLLEGEAGVHAVASPPSYAGHSFLDDDDVARTVYAMGTSLLSWTQDAFERGLLAADARVFGLTSEGNQVAWKGYAAVSAAKAALEAVARSIAVEFAPYGVRCNVIQPGVAETPASAAIPGSAHLLAQARLRNPMGRLTTPADVAGVIHLLSLDAAGWINGEVIRVDGGEHVSGASR